MNQLYVYKDPLFWISFPFRSPEGSTQSSLPASRFSLVTYFIHSINGLVVKNPPANPGDTSLGWEYPLEKEMATHSSILAWEIPWTEKPRGLQSTGLQRVVHDWAHTDINGVCVLIPTSQFIPSSFPSLVSIHLFSMSVCCRNQYLRNQAPHSESWRIQLSYTGGPRGVNTPSSEPRTKGLQSFYRQTIVGDTSC